MNLFHRASGRASLALSTVAVVVALSSGTAAVAGTVVTTKMIKNNAVTGAKVKNGSLTLADFAPAERALLVGPQGPAGPAGQNGTTNTPTVISSPDTYIAAGDIQAVVAFCPSGLHATGGGYFASVATAAASEPRQVDDGWGVVINNDSTIGVTVNAYVVCV